VTSIIIITITIICPLLMCLQVRVLESAAGPGRKRKKGKGLTSQQLMQAFLDHPNLLIMVVSGHHNVSHPKLLSMPLGPTAAVLCVKVASTAAERNQAIAGTFHKKSLLLTAGSNWNFRPPFASVCIKTWATSCW
jgi:hypothetical protein